MARTISIKYRGSAKASRYSIKKNASIKVDGAEAVDIFAAKSEITSMEQKGNDLVIRFADGVVTTLEGYFQCEASAQPAMAIVDSDARESLAVSFENGVCGAAAGLAQPLAYTVTPLTEGANAFLPAAAGIGLAPILGLGALAGGGAIAASSGGGDGDNGGGNTGGGDTGGGNNGGGNTGGGNTGGGNTGGGNTGGGNTGGGNTGGGNTGGGNTGGGDNGGGNTGGGNTGGGDNGGGNNGGGNNGGGNNGGGTGDTTPPAPPVLNPTNGTVITGTAEPGSKVTLDLDGNGTNDVTVDVDGQGNFTHTPATPSTDGTVVTGRATDAAGNTSGPGTTTVDASTPTPTIASVSDDIGAVTGAVANGGTTDDNRPLLSGGGAEANATVAIFDGATQLGTTTADAAGNWSFTPGTALADGPHSFTVKATDALGNVSANSPAYTVTIDSDGDGNGNGGGQVPTAPTITSVTDDVGSVTGPVARGGVSDDTRPTIAGAGAPANGTVTVYDGQTVLGTTTANAAGNWSFTPGAALADGPHSFTATAGTGQATSPASAPFAVTIDTAAPAAPTINPSDGTELTGTAEPGSTVDLDTDGDGDPDVSVPVDDSGDWSYTPDDPIPDGTQVTGTATDPAGNTSPPASTVVDGDGDVPEQPNAPVITVVTDDVGSVTGPVASGGVTDDRRPIITGTGAPGGATVSVYDGMTLIGTTTASGSGSWTLTPAASLGEGAHNLNARVTVDGSTSPASNVYTVVVDTTAPAAPTINPSDGESVTGTAEPGSVVNLDTNGDGTPDATAPVNGSGDWSYTPATPIPDGTTVTATASDPAGNTSAPASTVIDTDGDIPEQPDAPAITVVTDDVGTITGPIANGGVTDDNRPAITGTGAAAGSTVAVFDGATLIGTTTADGSGGWTLTPTAPLGDGSHNLVARVTVDGATSPSSAPFTVVVDTAAPPAPTIAPNNGSQLTGTAEPGSTVNLDLNGDGTPDATVTTGGNGSWSYTPATPIADDTVVTATATDAAGNTSGPATETVDRSTTVPTIDAVTDNVAPETGVVPSGDTTNDTTPTVNGSGAEAGATVSVFNGATLLGTTVADGAGNWTFTPGAPLAEGAYALRASATDTLGNASAQSAPYAITIDVDGDGGGTGVPTATVEITAITEDTGTPGDFQTEDTTPLVSGTLSEALAAGESVEVRIDGGAWVDATVSGTTFSYQSGALAEGSHTIEARVVGATDLVGDSDSQGIVILEPDGGGGNDNDAPLVQVRNADVLGLISAETISLIDFNDQGLRAVDPNNDLVSVEVAFRPLVNVNLGAYSLTASQTLAASLGLELEIVNNPGILGVVAPSSVLTITDADGGTIDNVAINQLLQTVRYEQDITLVGAQLLTATSITATDAQGNTASGTVGNLADLTLLNGSGPPPGTPTLDLEITAVTDVTGTVGDFETDDTTPLISGTLSAALGVGDTVEVRIDGGAWIDAAVNGTAWSYQSGLLGLGEHSIEARVVTAASAVIDLDTQPLLVSPPVANEPDAPLVQARNADLAGLVSAEVISLVDFNDQALTAVDPDNDLVSVEVAFRPLLSLDLDAYTLTASQALATTLGLEIDIENFDGGLLGLLAPSSVLTITDADGGTMDNVAVNQLLATVRYEQDVTGVGAQVLTATSITATDSEGNTDSDTVGNLVDISLLNGNSALLAVEAEASAGLQFG